ncbi:hypothetical protein BO71DRAFT_36336 [Aspergillus ellipticus CBS 707.79]|uniref:Uncharacterized protein n=1 Tax=Aspergillus ellipticus CBS 707.79 TaxID=1448320 RepID=A0A319DCD7_9EURO|nr:hypothetical protein BO71DRAFT_36336 [Aspergillus ellipticus CBS 707.79]
MRQPARNQERRIEDGMGSYSPVLLFCYYFFFSFFFFGFKILLHGRLHSGVKQVLVFIVFLLTLDSLVSIYWLGAFFFFFFLYWDIDLPPLPSSLVGCFCDLLISWFLFLFFDTLFCFLAFGLHHSSVIRQFYRVRPARRPAGLWRKRSVSGWIAS